MNKNTKIKILTWNLGYAGLGCESSFFFDAKGRGQIFPDSKVTVLKNLNGQINTITNANANINLLQEVTTASIMNYKINMVAELKAKLNFKSFFVQTMNINFPIKINHGNLTMCKLKQANFKTDVLPSKKKWLHPKYNYIELRHPITKSKKELVVFNIHFNAFDKHGEDRYSQLDFIFNLANYEYNCGNYVIIGGDFNLALTKTNFKTTEPYPFWLRDISNKLKTKIKNSHWNFAFDSKLPSVRTLTKPYDKNNYTSIIDGFLCSPNINILSTKCINTNFIYSDHNPIILEFNYK